MPAALCPQSIVRSNRANGVILQAARPSRHDCPSSVPTRVADPFPCDGVQRHKLGAANCGRHKPAKPRLRWLVSRQASKVHTSCSVEHDKLEPIGLGQRCGTPTGMYALADITYRHRWIVLKMPRRSQEVTCIICRNRGVFPIVDASKS